MDESNRKAKLQAGGFLMEAAHEALKRGIVPAWLTGPRGDREAETVIHHFRPGEEKGQDYHIGGGVEGHAAKLVSKSGKGAQSRRAGYQSKRMRWRAVLDGRNYAAVTVQLHAA
ncbi:hypothetical protein [Pusillimonas noertemannii]|uniref:hypothetical protein n=1 Tax=Pusillimonas noertemannii TaxID=305977 RepID=UPI000E3008D6|nr:hypothetical protein [Pusillimonas noertemannii]NYT69313.1 hypothetical protein [Pusillimonas noertemannii]TFL09714.1 hypothetical protein CSC72_12640 [Pusillimonas noertemannii]